MKLIIQTPCFNEEQALPAILADLPSEAEGFDVTEYLVIDNGSTDRTIEIARERGVHQIDKLVKNRGKARAFMAGLEDIRIRQIKSVLDSPDRWLPANKKC
jgi:glycosyltransferase involved in cell wall biosynthesis